MDSRPLHVLFVDDAFETRDLFRLCFSLSGHTCQTAHNGSKALELISEKGHTFDVIIMDYHMPDKNGLDVVQELRQREEVPATPIILFTGTGPGQIERRARRLGVTHVLYKPIRPVDLMSAVKEAVRVKDSKEEFKFSLS
jgi:CheY-like chemotaxis protein